MARKWWGEGGVLLILWNCSSWHPVTRQHIGILASTRPKVISTGLKKKLMSRIIWLQLFCNLNSPKKITRRLGKLRTEFTSPIAKSTSPRLSDTTFFARWNQLVSSNHNKNYYYDKQYPINETLITRPKNPRSICTLSQTTILENNNSQSIL